MFRDFLRTGNSGLSVYPPFMMRPRPEFGAAGLPSGGRERGSRTSVRRFVNTFNAYRHYFNRFSLKCPSISSIFARILAIKNFFIPINYANSFLMQNAPSIWLHSDIFAAFAAASSVIPPRRPSARRWPPDCRSPRSPPPRRRASRRAFYWSDSSRCSRGCGR